MLTKDDVEQLGKVIEQKLEAERAQTRKVVQEEIQASEQRVKTEIKKAILDAQEDTIKALSDLVQEGYHLHEQRMKNIEDHIGLPHPQ